MLRLLHGWGCKRIHLQRPNPSLVVVKLARGIHVPRGSFGHADIGSRNPCRFQHPVGVAVDAVVACPIDGCLAQEPEVAVGGRLAPLLHYDIDTSRSGAVDVTVLELLPGEAVPLIRVTGGHARVDLGK
jgi:hypothetical protein